MNRKLFNRAGTGLPAAGMAVLLALGLALAGCGDGAGGSGNDGGGVDSALVAKWHLTQDYANADNGNTVVFEIADDGSITGTAFNTPATVTTSGGRITITTTASGQPIESSADYVTSGSTLKFSNPNAGAGYFTSLITTQNSVNGYFYKKAGSGNGGGGNNNGGDGGGSGDFVAVTNIVDLPGIALANVELELSGTVKPANATNTTITWSGDKVTNGVFKAASTGNYQVTATIAQGKSQSSSYTQQFTIEVRTADPIQLAQGTWTGELLWGGTPFPAKMVINNVYWEISGTFGGSEELLNKGIILNVNSTDYLVQQTHEHDGNNWFLHYAYSSGTYVFSNGNKALTVSQMGETWATLTKQN